VRPAHTACRASRNLATDPVRRSERYLIENKQQARRSRCRALPGRDEADSVIAGSTNSQPAETSAPASLHFSLGSPAVGSGSRDRLPWRRGRSAWVRHRLDRSAASEPRVRMLFQLDAVARAGYGRFLPSAVTTNRGKSGFAARRLERRGAGMLWRTRVPVAAVVAGAITVVVTLFAARANAAERVYWSNNAGNKISFANVDGTGGGDLSTTGATVSSPRGAAIDTATGRVYWADAFANRISFARLDGGGGADLNTSGATVSAPTGVAVDPAAGRIYWANQGGSEISYGNLDGSGGGDLTTAGATVNGPEGVTVDPTAGRVYWANFSGNEISYANVNGTGGGDLGVVLHPSGIAIDRDLNKIYWARRSDDLIGVGDLNPLAIGAGTVSTAGATVDDPSGVAVDAASGKIYWGNNSGNKISFAALDGTGGGDLATPGATVSGPRFVSLLRSPSGTGAPGITGGSVTGSTLSCSSASWAPDKLSAFLYQAPTMSAYQWSRDGVNIAGANASSYRTTAPGGYSCHVTASNAAGSATQTSAGHDVLAPPPPPSNVSPPAILGGLVRGQTLHEVHGSWRGSPTAFAYQWEVCDRSGSSCVAISGATTQSYTLTISDVGHTIRVLESATNAFGTTSPVASGATSLVQPDRATIIALLLGVTPKRNAASIRAILANNGYTVKFATPVLGSLSVRWYFVAPGTRLSRVGKPVLVASATARFKTAGKHNVVLRLTRHGKLLLRRSKRLKLKAKAQFTPSGGGAVRIVKAFTLMR
jgi:DNA-binding beta-propeller fold protein YncE